MRVILKTFSILVPVVILSACDGMARKEMSVQDVLPPPATMAAEAEQRGDWAAAARHWQAASFGARNDRAISLSMIRAMRLAGSCGAASAHIGRLLSTDPKDADALLESAKCNLVSGQPEAAETTLKALLATRPDWWEAQTTLGVTLDRFGRHTEALEHHEEAARLAPGKAIAVANKGLSLALAGRLAEGVATMRAAAALPGAPTRVRVDLAVLEALNGDGDRAATILSQESIDDKAEAMAQVQRLARSAKKGAVVQ